MGWYSALASVASFSWKCTKAATKFTARQIGKSGAAVMTVGVGSVAVGAYALVGVPATVAIAVGAFHIVTPLVATAFEAGKLAVRSHRRNARARAEEQAAEEESKRLAEACRETNESLDRLIPTMETNANIFQQAITLLNGQAVEQVLAMEANVNLPEVAPAVIPAVAPAVIPAVAPAGA